MSESACVHCANAIPQGARICANCGMPVSEVPLLQAEEAPPREAGPATQRPAPFPPVGQPTPSLPPTPEAQQNRVGRRWLTYPPLRGSRGSAKIIRPEWLRSWFTLPVVVIAGIVVTLAFLFVRGSVQADASDLLGLSKTLPGRESKEAQTVSEDVPTGTPSSSPPASPSDFLSSFLPPFLSASPAEPNEQSSQTALPASPSPLSTSGGAGACQQDTDADDFAQALDFSDAKSLADYLGLKGGKDKLAQVLRDCNGLEDLASSLGFSTPERLAAYLGLNDKRELVRSLRVSAELNKLAQSLGLDSSEELAKRLGVKKRKLMQDLRDSENSEELAQKLGLESPEKFAERLGVKKDELSTFFDSATTDEGKSATDNNTFTEGNDSKPSATDDDKSLAGEGNTATDESKSGANGRSMLTTDNDEPAAKETAVSETPSSTISTPLSPASSASPPPPPPPLAKGNEQSAPATDEPPPVTQDVPSPLTTNKPPSDTSSSPSTSEPLSSPSTSKTSTSEPSQELRTSGN